MKSKIALAVSLALTGVAFAGDEQATENSSTLENQETRSYSQPQVSGPVEAHNAHSDILNLENAEIKGKAVVDLQGEKVGDVDKVWINQMTQEKMVVIDLQGVFGDDSKEVAVPLKELELTEDGDELRTAYSKEDLRARPDIDESDFSEMEEAE